MSGRSGGREVDWRRVIARQSKSGLSVAEFCRRESVSEPRFYYWKRKLRHQGDSEVPPDHPGSRAATATVASCASLVPVEIEQAMPTGAIRIQWPSGVCVDVPCGVTSQEIAGILQTLHQLEPGPKEKT